MSDDKPTPVNILTIPDGPIIAGPGKVNSKEIISLAEYASNYGMDSPAGKFGGFDVTAPPIIPGQLELLSKAHSVYLEILLPDENLDFLTGSPNYEIKTAGGGRLFAASDNSNDGKPCFCHGGNSHHEKFDFNLYDSFGRQVLNITGHLGGCAVGACVKVNTANNNIGTIIQGDCNSPHYVVVNWEGKEIYSIHHGERGSVWHNLRMESVDPTQFGIYKTSEVERKLFLVGTFYPMTCRVDVNEETHESSLRPAIRLTFPAQCDLANKLLLLGALFVVDYRIVRREGRQLELRGHHNCQRFWTIPCLGITFGSLMTIVIVAVLLYELIVHVMTKPMNAAKPVKY